MQTSKLRLFPAISYILGSGTLQHPVPKYPQSMYFPSKTFTKIN